MLKIPKSVADRLSGQLLYGENIEKELLPVFSLENRNLIDYHAMMAKRVLSYHFGEESKNKDTEDVYVFIRKEIFTTVVSMFLSNVSILLLNQTEEIEFKDIIFDSVDKENYYFKLIME